MISIFSGTNNPNGNSRIIADYVKEILDSLHEANQMFDLVNIPPGLIHEGMY